MASGEDERKQSKQDPLPPKTVSGVSNASLPSALRASMKMRRLDSFATLSAEARAKDKGDAASLSDLEAPEPPQPDDGAREDAKDHDHGVQLPAPLVMFLAAISACCGFLVVGFHKSMYYAGCGLKLNGCDKSLAIDAVRAVLGDWVPEDAVVVVLSVMGTLFVLLLWHRLPEDLAFQVQGGGTVQSLVAVAGGYRIPLSGLVLRVVVSCVVSGSGGPLGGEGPAIQICVALATVMGWAVGMRSHATQSLLACLGFVAGFAASFNAPISGILFALEELEHASPYINQELIVVLAFAAVTATASERALHGVKTVLTPGWNQEALAQTSGSEFQAVEQVFGMDTWMLIAVPIGVLSALFGSGMIYALRLIYRRLEAHDAVRAGTPRTVVMIGHAVVCASIGSVCWRATGLRGVWGLGNATMQEAFDTDVSAGGFLLFSVSKATAMMIAVALRAPGGFLMPTLVVGQFLGGFVGRVLEQAAGYDAELSEQVVKSGMVFGMVGVFASLFRFPLTPAAVALELTGIDTYPLVLPALLCSSVSLACSNRIIQPILAELMEQKNIDLHELAHHTQEGEEDVFDCGEAFTRHVSRDSGGPDGFSRRTSRDSNRSSGRSGAQVPRPKFGEKWLEETRAAFQTVDKDGSGGIDIEEFVEAFMQIGSHMKRDGIEHFFAEADKDGSGTIDFDEFVSIMKKVEGFEESGAETPPATPRSPAKDRRPRSSLGSANSSSSDLESGQQRPTSSPRHQVLESGKKAARDFVNAQLDVVAVAEAVPGERRGADDLGAAGACQRLGVNVDKVWV